MEKVINGSKLQLALADYLATNSYINDTAQDVLVMVAKWIDEAPEVNGWIPVTERLPGEKISVLVCLSSKVNAVARIMDGGWKLAWNHKPIAVVTHWMPLPEPPKEVE